MPDIPKLSSIVTPPSEVRPQRTPVALYNQHETAEREIKATSGLTIADKQPSNTVNTARNVEPIDASELSSAVSPYTTIKFGNETFNFITPETLKNSGVYSYFDEGEQLSTAVQKYIQSNPGAPHFETVVDLFAGAGHASIPVMKRHDIKAMIQMDIDKKALSYAKQNADLNGLSSDRITSKKYNIETDQFPQPEKGKTLYIANPPFAVNYLGVEMDRIRDGGSDGLKLTQLAIQKFFTVAKQDSVLVGLAYAQIKRDDNGEITHNQLAKLLNTEAKTIEGHKANIKTELLADQTLWRGINGRKEQQNPMPLTLDCLSAKAKNEEEKARYREVADTLKEQGQFTHLAYFKYVIDFRKE